MVSIGFFGPGTAMTPEILTSADLGNHDAPSLLSELWNVALRDAYGFFPLTPTRLATRIFEEPRFRAERLLFAFLDGRPAGFLHWDLVAEPYYAQAAAVEVVGVTPELRGKGIGAALLGRALEGIARTNACFVDAWGTFPYTPFYSTLIDGSERSGPFLTDSELLAFFERHGFRRDRESLIMRRDLRHLPPEEPGRSPDASVLTSASRSGKTTWLDFVFRGWSLRDRFLVRPDGQILSRAITARMDGLSGHTGRERHALFGVNTPESLRGEGHATRMLRELLFTLAAEGADEVELHVYADNTPAVHLYRRCAFEEIARTTVMRRARI